MSPLLLSGPPHSAFLPFCSLQVNFSLRDSGLFYLMNYRNNRHENATFIILKTGGWE